MADQIEASTSEAIGIESFEVATFESKTFEVTLQLVSHMLWPTKIETKIKTSARRENKEEVQQSD